MTAAFAPSPWPLPATLPRGGPWLFGRVVVLEGRPNAPHALQWLLQRNGSITARRIGLAYLLLCLGSALVALLFLARGATLLLGLTVLELAALGLACLVWARHVADHETLTLVGRSLQVEQCFGSHVERTDFAAAWTTVEPAAGQGSLVELSARGRSVRVGRFLRPELRSAFARELRLALRRSATRGAQARSDAQSY
jgi:uncharacterized membrane protein